MISWLKHLFRRRRKLRITEIPRSPAILLTQSCEAALTRSLQDAYRRRHEGVCFLLGQSDGRTVLCVLAVRPKAQTTRGSFHIPAQEMAKIVSIATENKLQIVAQIHTHPAKAFHSGGDVEGANIRFEGFVSIVVPDYGAALPKLAGAAVYLFNRERHWEEVPTSSVRVVPSEILR